MLVALALHVLIGEEEHDLDALLSRGALGSIALAVSVSLDELAIGFTLGLLRVPILLVIAVIALQAFAVSQLGMRLGERIGDRAREGAERLAGATLALLAIGLLVTKLTG